MKVIKLLWKIIWWHLKLGIVIHAIGGVGFIWRYMAENDASILKTLYWYLKTTGENYKSFWEHQI